MAIIWGISHFHPFDIYLYIYIIYPIFPICLFKQSHLLLGESPPNTSTCFVCPGTCPPKRTLRSAVAECKQWGLAGSNSCTRGTPEDITKIWWSEWCASIEISIEISLGFQVFHVFSTNVMAWPMLLANVAWNPRGVSIDLPSSSSSSQWASGQPPRGPAKAGGKLTSTDIIWHWTDIELILTCHELSLGILVAQEKVQDKVHIKQTCRGNTRGIKGFMVIQCWRGEESARKKKLWMHCSWHISKKDKAPANSKHDMN